MDIEFDAAKDEINRLKHGIPLVLGAKVLMNRIGQIAGSNASRPPATI